MSEVEYLAIKTRYLDRIEPAQVRKILPTGVRLVYFPVELTHVSSQFLSKEDRKTTMVFKASIEKLPEIIAGLGDLEYCYGLGSMPTAIKILASNMLSFVFDTESG